MSEMRLEPIRDRNAWTAAELAADPSWIHRVSEAEVAEIERALERALSAGIAHAPFRSEEFALPQFAPTLARLLDEVENGRGVALLRGLPVERYDAAAVRALYWGIGTYLGQAISQNSRGEMVASVIDRGNDHDDMNVRGYKTRAELAPHVDSCDMTSLLCLRAAATGGDSLLTSSMSVYNVILSEHRALLETFYHGFHHDLRGEGVTGEIDEVTTNAFPIYSYFDGVLSCAFNSRIMRSAREKVGPPLSEKEDAAIDLIIELARREDLQYRFQLEPGDLEFFNNYTVLHARDSYHDTPGGDEPAPPSARRELLRLWYRFHHPRVMKPGYGDRYNTGDRGGVAIGDGAQYTF